MSDLRHIEDKILYKACEECVADAGKEDDALVMRLYNFMYENYDKQGKSWNYDMIDNLIKQWDNKPELRNLDGVYFRIQREGKWKNICFSDLTETEMDSMLENRDVKWLSELCKILGKTLREVGDFCDIAKE